MQVRHPDRQIPLFRTGFFEALNPGHELVRAARRIDWKGLHRSLLPCYSTIGRSGKPTRLMAGLHFLKLRFGCSDAAAVEELHENVYWQYFCGLTSFQKGPILEASALVRFRKRLGEKKLEELGDTFAGAWEGLLPPEKKPAPRFRTLPSFLRKRNAPL